jgi:hypothetical protein
MTSGRAETRCRPRHDHLRDTPTGTLSLVTHPNQTPDARPDVGPPKPGGSWLNIWPLMSFAAVGWVQVLWVSDTAHPGNLALLICISIAFGIALSQLPPVRAWLERRDHPGQR